MILAIYSNCLSELHFKLLALVQLGLLDDSSLADLQPNSVCYAILCCEAWRGLYCCENLSELSTMLATKSL